MKTIRVLTFVLGMAVVLCGSTATADLLNGGFETGDFTSWSAGGSAQVVQWEDPRDFLYAPFTQAPFTPVPGYPTLNEWQPNEGSYFASLWSTGGSSLNQTFTTPSWTTASGAYVLEFDYFYDFGDWAGFGESPALISVNDGAGNSIWNMTINDPWDPAGSTGLADDQNIDWTTVSVVLPSAGTYTLGFTLTDLGGYESILGVDNVQIVPVPGAFLLGAIGLGYASCRLRKRRMS